jgi:hypothetical protein
MGRDVMSVNTKFRMYFIIVSGLRMATDYSFDVWPVESGNREVHGHDIKLLHKSIIVSTRGCKCQNSNSELTMSFNI